MLLRSHLINSVKSVVFSTCCNSVEFQLQMSGRVSEKTAFCIICFNHCFNASSIYPASLMTTFPSAVSVNLSDKNIVTSFEGL